MTRLITFWLAAHTAVLGGQFIMAPELGLATQSGWSATLNETYYEGKACYARIPTTANLVRGTVQLGRSYPAGVWKVWLRATSVSYPGEVTLSMGGGSATFRFSNGVWTPVLVSASSAFSELVLEFMKTATATVTQDYHVNGLYLSGQTNEGCVSAAVLANSGSLFLDYTPPASTNLTDAAPGNLVANSSFELGLSHGWGFSRKALPGMAVWRSEVIDTTTAAHGTCSVRIADAYARYSLNSPAIRIRGDRTLRKYTLSWWAKGTGPALLVAVGHVVPAVSGLPSPERYTFNTGAPGSTWKRYSQVVWLSSVPSREIYFDFYHTGTGSQAIWIDAVQFEEGDLTAYAPQDTVEFSLGTDRNANVYHTGEGPSVRLNLANYGTVAVEREFNYEVYDWMNRLSLTRALNLSVAAGSSQLSLDLGTLGSGSSRIVGWFTELGGVRDEAIVSVIPPAVPNLATNSFIGTHGVFANRMALSNRVWGLGWNRSLSPGGFFRWAKIEPTEGNFDWRESDAAVAEVAGTQLILASLHEPPEPAWALTNDYPRIDRWSNYIYRVVSRYKDRIKYWEDFNEALYHHSAAAFAPLLEATAAAVKAADPNAYFIAMGGSPDVTWAQCVWALLTPEAKARIDAVSTHLYPSGIRFMQSDAQSTYKSWQTFGASIGKPVWNSESGSWSVGMRKTDVIGWITTGAYPYDFLHEELSRRGNYIPWERTLHSVFRSAGHGFAHYFYYDGRLAEYLDRYPDTAATMFEYDDAMRPDGAAILWAQYWLRNATTLGRITNSAAPLVEAYLFSDGTKSMVVCWNQDKTNRLASLGTSAFAVYDGMGNRVQTNQPTALITRQPRYWVTSSLTPELLRSHFLAASITGARDPAGPNVSVDSSPHGRVKSSQYPLLFRWTAIDDTYVNTEAMPSCVRTRYRLNGRDTDWSAWSAQRLLEIDSLTAGVYSLSVQAIDAEGNVGPEVTGPEFDLRVPPPGKLRTR